MKKKGFTLIELLVVISIISMLTSVVLASLSDSRKKARDAQRIQSLVQLRTALEMYYADNGNYPIVNLTVDGNVYTGPSYDRIKWNSWGHQNLYNALVPKYITSLAQDPLTYNSTSGYNSGYLRDSSVIGSVYVSKSDGSCYILGTNLEKGNLPHIGSDCGGYQIISGNCKCTAILSGTID
jgi:prepilin-type N-terminal cleavage/methylation domain-containing protein